MRKKIKKVDKYIYCSLCRDLIICLGTPESVAIFKRSGLCEKCQDGEYLKEPLWLMRPVNEC